MIASRSESSGKATLSHSARFVSQSNEEKLQRAETLSSKIKDVVEEIQRVTKELREKRQELSKEFSDIAKEVSRNVPKIYCSSTDHDRALKSGDYYVIGLPQGVDPKKVRIHASSRRTDLMIDDKEYEGDWDHADTEEEVLEEILRRRKKTGK